jgi:hypothetical protein
MTKSGDYADESNVFELKPVENVNAVVQDYY